MLHEEEMESEVSFLLLWAVILPDSEQQIKPGCRVIMQEKRR